MTLNELKELFEEHKQLTRKRTEIFNNDDLSKNQMKKEEEKILPRMEEILGILAEYSSVFSVKAHILSKHIKEVLSHSISESSISCSHTCTGEYYDKEYFEGIEKVYQGKACLEIYIESLGKTETISLFNRQVSKNLSDDIDYFYGIYDVNCLEILNNSNIKYRRCFHNACWLAIEENLKNKNFNLRNKADRNKKLILKKIEELQAQANNLQNKRDEIANNKTIILTTKEIEDITKKI